jgi:hypothetical protein
MPKLVLAAGIRRSGSTWLYNVIRFAFINAGYTTYSDFYASYQPETPADVHVVKVHEFVANLAEQNPLVLTTYRDLRDIAASCVRLKLAENTPESLRLVTKEVVGREYSAWKSHANLEIRYADMIRDRPAAIRRVLRALGLNSVDPREVDRDVQKLSFMAFTDLDPVSQLWPQHITDGGVGSYRKFLSDASIEAIEEVGGPWLATHGYRLETPRLRRTYSFSHRLARQVRARILGC